MKCPYRTITTKSIEKTVYKNEEVTRVEFADCLEVECPFYGSKGSFINERTMRHETRLTPVCRRAENEQRETN